MQLITATGPVLGEGLLDGWEGSIELRGFDWGMKAHAQVADQSGAGFGLGGLKSALGMAGKNVPIEMEPLTFTKRFDVSSSSIYTSASTTTSR